MRMGNLSDLGHASWVVSERFSNTAQFSDNLTKVYKSHTFKTGYMYQDIFFGSTQPPYARGEYNWDGRYTSLVNQLDNSTGRVQMLLNQIPSLVPGGVDFLGGQHEIRVSPFGDVDAFKTYHGAYAQDSWRATDRLTVNYGVRWDYFSREQEREAEQANMVPGPPARYLIPAEWRDKQLSPSFAANLARDGIELVYTDEFGSGLGKMPKNNFAPRLDAAYQLSDKYVHEGGLWAVLRRVREPRRQPEPRLQLPVPVHPRLPVAERHRAEPACRTDRWSAWTPAIGSCSTRSTSTPTV